MIDSVEVKLWNTTVGYLYDSINPKFEYDKNFLNSGMELSPVKMPLSKTVYSFPDLSKTSFKGLPGMFADSLPDRFGNAVIDRWLLSQGRSSESFSALERLCYTGTRGMGALEYFPAMGPQFDNDEIDVSEMVKLASDVLSRKNSVEINQKSAGIQQLLSIGSSAGGARPKAIIAYNEETGSIKSGQINAGDGYDYWIIKFDGVTNSGDHGVSDPEQFTKIEYAYYLMAKDAGINMNECRLLEKDGRYHFMTKRFDRVDNQKLHMQSLAAIGHYDYNYPGLCSYEKYADIAVNLGLNKNDIKEIYKRMVFSVFSCNYDDHVKNFSFLMDKNGKWNLSPAYDITFAYVPGNKWLSAHQMTINGKKNDITIGDLLSSGKAMSLPMDCCKDIIDTVQESVNKWIIFAEKSDINHQKSFEINEILQHNSGLVRSNDVEYMHTHDDINEDDIEW